MGYRLLKRWVQLPKGVQDRCRDMGVAILFVLGHQVACHTCMWQSVFVLRCSSAGCAMIYMTPEFTGEHVSVCICVEMSFDRIVYKIV